MSKHILHILIACFFCVRLAAQNVQIIGNPGIDEYGYAVTGDVNGNVYVGGVKDLNGLITKLDGAGNVVWSKSFVLNTLPSQNVNVTHMGVSGDTLFGCGWINSGSTLLGHQYFKMNAITGDFYWTRSETSSGIYFSSMRYDAGRYYLAGSKTTSSATWDGKLMCVSSADGSIIWQNGTWGMTFPSFSNDYVDDFYAMSEIVDGKFFLAGRSYVNGAPLDMRPTLIGFDLSGTMILQKYLLLPDTDAGVDRFYGIDIKFDGSDSLIMAFFGDDNCTGSCMDIKVGLIKTDTSGNVSFSKTYDIPSSPREVSRTVNVTDDAYVIYGGTDYAAANSGIFAIKTDKNGIFQNATVITKSGTTLRANPGTFTFGSCSVFTNSVHSFTAAAYTTDPNIRDAVLIQMDENLQSTNDCFTFQSVSVTTQDYTPYQDNLVIIDKANTVNPLNGYVAELYTLSACGENDIEFDQTPYGCDSVLVTATSLTGTVYEISWPTGATGNTETFYVQDTVLVGFFNPVTCCEFTDTVFVELANTTPAANLPADTSVCLTSGAQFMLIPQVTDCSTCTFVWNTGAVDSVLMVDSSGWYAVTVTNACGLQDQDSVYLVINNFPLLQSIPDTVLCPANLPVNISASALYADSLVWSNGVNGSTSFFTMPEAAFVQAFNICGTVLDSFLIDTLASVILQPLSDIDTCVSTGQLVAIPVVAFNYDVVTANGVALTPPVLTATGDTTYILAASNVCGQSNDTVSILVNFFPDLGVINDTVICPGALPVSFSAYATNVDSIVWSNGDIGTVGNYANAGPAFVQVFSACGTIQENFTIDTLSQPFIQPISDVDSCLYPGEVLNISVSATNYSMFTANGVVITAPLSLSAQTDTIFTLLASNTCAQDSLQFTVTIGNYPAYINSVDIDTCLANGTQVEIGVSVTDGTLTWWNGSSLSEQVITSSGIYYFSVANTCGTLTDSIIALYDSQQPDHVLPNLDSCLTAGDSLLISFTESDLIVFWSSNGNDTLFVTESGIYFAEVATPCGVIYDSMHVIIHEMVEPFNLDTIHVCGKSFSVNDLPTEEGYTAAFVHTDGTLTGSEIYETGDYLFQQTGSCGQFSQQIHIIFDTEILFYAPNSFTPDGDILNNVYEFKGENYVIDEVLIMNRWGEVVYSQTGGFDGWDGTYNNTSCPTGTYVVKVFYYGCDGSIQEEYLHVNLLR